ncbi:hypothetical protein DICPUDRAFT_154173 [Dictyostelium purpureum]|uniref:Uncharacterized protein n=1 Tax=Dictyostelium purpureum TaxID=5786 RepID=F0ZQN4_DICPU|nr:uncharacterized protein DICPUDRAFT_154173 [Dictyostelium purpureum]EGC33729.1 hypothetical protein DICPUDRAFT_154173 [Dictyostelium purpureum]|eukprot:XP_003289728.1 hypothetical protein DICPUDRAFT_154173 [Dictyostelium purpureum]
MGNFFSKKFTMKFICLCVPVIEITNPQNGTSKAVPLELRYGILPRESVCTENLTPLPCREQSGIGKLLAPNKLYDVHYN